MRKLLLVATTCIALFPVFAGTLYKSVTPDESTLRGQSILVSKQRQIFPTSFACFIAN
jgi:hypothetical protein